jgi:hypothetical protein
VNLMRGAALGLAAIATAGLVGCATATPPAPAPSWPRQANTVTPYYSFDTSTNTTTVSGPLAEKRRSEDPWDLKANGGWVFRFDLHPDVATTDKVTVLVSKQIYDHYEVGDWVALRCLAAGLCVLFYGPVPS